MLDRLKGLSFAIVRWALTWMTAPNTLGAETLPPHTRIVYVLNTRSLTDLVMLDIVTRAHNLPGPREPLTEHGIPERYRFFFLNRPTGFPLRRNSMRTYSKRLLRLQGYFRDTRKADISLVPVSIFWSRAPDRERSLIRVLLSEDWTVTSRFRRFVTILFNRRDITVHFGAPIALREIAEPQISDARLVRRIARRSREQFGKQRTALLGPDLSHRRLLIERIVASRNVRAAIASEAASTRAPVLRVTRRARRNARSVASNMSYVTIRILQRLLTWFWNRIYDGIDVSGIERIKQLAETATLVYVPCHRSHLDYLVLSYLLYEQGLMIPHIAAGDNLDMPAVGPLLRRGGAFFMRRSFRDDRVYAAVFSEYLYQLMQQGSPSEYFIEGGRSRTGRLLPPRTGLLNMTIATRARGVSRTIVFVPVNIGYEKLIEAASYLDELRGARKQRESVLDVLRAVRLLKEAFGRVHVSFGTALSLDEFLQGRANDANLARDLGIELLGRINACAHVNPIHLIALVTLATPKQSLDEAQLVEQLDCLANLLRANTPFSDITVTAMAGARMISHAEKLGMIVRESFPLGDVLGHDANSAVLMTWYRNNVCQAFALPSLIACLLTNRRRRIGRAALQDMIATVYPYLQSELYLEPSDTLDIDIGHWLDHLHAQGLVRRTGDEIGPPARESGASYRFALLAQIVMPMLERFFIVVGLLQQAGQRRIDRASLERDCIDMARRIARLYGLNAPEFFDARLFHTFVDTLIERGAVKIGDDGTLEYVDLIGAVTRASSGVLTTEFRAAVLRANPRIASTDVQTTGAAPR
ncbi:MAG TPA: glycerol-3-phosphate 1-O-acyltransferase PlsB [Pseudomonadales bacterium]